MTDRDLKSKNKNLYKMVNLRYENIANFMKLSCCFKFR